jgi:hypothetical protein
MGLPLAAVAVFDAAVFQGHLLRLQALRPCPLMCIH